MFLEILCRVMLIIYLLFCNVLGLGIIVILTIVSVIFSIVIVNFSIIIVMLSRRFLMSTLLCNLFKNCLHGLRTYQLCRTEKKIVGL